MQRWHCLLKISQKDVLSLDVLSGHPLCICTYCKCPYPATVVTRFPYLVPFPFLFFVLRPTEYQVIMPDTKQRFRRVSY